MRYKVLILAYVEVFISVFCFAQNENYSLQNYCIKVINKDRIGKKYRYKENSYTYYYSNKDSIQIYGTNAVVYATDFRSKISSIDTILEVLKVLSKYNLTYLGKLQDKKGNYYKVVTNFMIYGSAESFRKHAKGKSEIYFFDNDNEYIGKFRSDLPTHIKNNKLWIDDEEFYPSFDNGVPKFLYLKEKTDTTNYIEEGSFQASVNKKM